MKKVIISWLILLCVGCGVFYGPRLKLNYVYFFPDDIKTTYEATNVEDIVIFPHSRVMGRNLAGETIAANYARIGRLVGEGPWDVMEERFLKKCAEWGCDAIQFGMKSNHKEGSYAADSHYDIEAVAYRAERKELRIKSNYTRQSLIEGWKDSITRFEGIYEDLKRADERIAVKKLSDREYAIIHISGKRWKEGDIRGKLYIHGSSLYRVEWYITEEYSDSNYYMVLLEYGLVLKNEYLNTEINYFQVYPDGINVDIKKGKSQGTGFAINSGGYILTNHHVVEGRRQFKVIGVDGDFQTEYDAKIVVTDRVNDLAVIKIDRQIDDIPYTFDYSILDVGESVMALGYPQMAVMGEELKVTAGVVNAQSGYKGNITEYQIGALIYGGNSGGPLFDKHGNVAGVNSSGLKDFKTVNYAVKIILFRNMLAAAGLDIDVNAENTVSHLPQTEQIKKIRNYVYIIEVE